MSDHTLSIQRGPADDMDRDDVRRVVCTCGLKGVWLQGGTDGGQSWTADELAGASLPAYEGHS